MSTTAAEDAAVSAGQEPQHTASPFHDVVLGCETEIPSLVLKVLADHGWGAVVTESIEVKDYSGNSGAKTYKISCDASAPPVALRWRPEGTKSEDRLKTEKTEAALHIFAANGLGVQRLVHGVNWHIEVWHAGGAPKFVNVEQWRELGRLIAKMHSIDTAWFSEWAKQACCAHPALQDLGPGSHMWCFAFHTCKMWDQWEEEVRQAFMDAASFLKPESAAGQRIVTAHLDLHPGNMVLKEAHADDLGSIVFIDLDQTCVTSAVQDFAFIFTWAVDTWQSWEVPLVGAAAVHMRRELLVSYLEATGQSTQKEDVDQLYIDAEIMAMAGHSGGIMCDRLGVHISDREQRAAWRNAESGQVRVKYMLAQFPRYKQAVEAIRARQDLRSAILTGAHLQKPGGVVLWYSVIDFVENHV